jgi:WD40 repeat protein
VRAKDTSYLVVGKENGEVSVFDTTTPEPVFTFTAQTSRVKDLDVLYLPDQTQLHTLLTTVSSEGDIKVWKCNFEGEFKAEEVASHKVDARITCLSTVSREDLMK